MGSWPIDGVIAVPTDDRVEASIATATWAFLQGARMVRAHDVLPTAHAAQLVCA